MSVGEVKEGLGMSLDWRAEGGPGFDTWIACIWKLIVRSGVESNLDKTF